MRVASVKTAMNEFQTTGIIPLNPCVFPEWAFDHNIKPKDFSKINWIS
jgi:hypothetical protein